MVNELLIGNHYHLRFLESKPEIFTVGAAVTIVTMDQKNGLASHAKSDRCSCLPKAKLSGLPRGQHPRAKHKLRALLCASDGRLKVGLAAAGQILTDRLHTHRPLSSSSIP